MGSPHSFGGFRPVLRTLVPTLLYTAATEMFISRFLSRGPKEYSGHMVLGKRTDTYDAEGRILEERPSAGIGLEQICSEALALTGELMQVPPPWSAKKVQGQRAYDLARAGRIVEAYG